MPRRSPSLVQILIGVTVLLSIILLYRSPVCEGFQSQPTIDLVIARYKEPIDWLQKYKDFPFRRVYIYNKSESTIECPKVGRSCYIESVPNVGVCDHTYLYHILKVYNDPDLADMTVFLPASAFSHETKKEKIGKILKLSKENKPSMSAYQLGAGQTIRSELGDFYLNEWKVSDEKNRDTGADFQLVKADPRPFGLWYKKYFPNENADRVSVLGMFAVTRDMIQGNSFELYTTLIKTVERDKFPEAAHYMERSWATLFKSIPTDSIF